MPEDSAIKGGGAPSGSWVELLAWIDAAKTRDPEDLSQLLNSEQIAGTAAAMAVDRVVLHSLQNKCVPVSTSPNRTVTQDFLDMLVLKGYLNNSQVGEILNDDDLQGFISITSNKKKSKGKKLSVEHRDTLDYDPMKCPCRTWKPNGTVSDIGLKNVQCSKKIKDGMVMCNMHTKKLVDGEWWLGLVTDDPPDEPVIHPEKGKPHFWTMEAKKVWKEKKKSAKKPKEDSIKSPKNRVMEHPKEHISPRDTEVLSDEDEDIGKPFFFNDKKYIVTSDGDVFNPSNYDHLGEDNGNGGIKWISAEMEEKYT